MTERKFYDPTRAISYNAPLTLVLSMRSYGKTYGFTREAIKDWMRDRSEFVYVRRYETELKTAAPKLFDDIMAHNEFPGYVFKMVGYEGFIAKQPLDEDEKPDWQPLCHCIPASKQANYKGVAFPKVKKIIWDEYIRMTKVPPGYLPDDMGSLFNLFKTVARDRTNVHMYLLANTCSILNPLFWFAGIRDEPKEGFSWHRGKSILIEYTKDEVFADQERATPVGRLIAGTAYEDEMIDAEFHDSTETFIAKKTKRSAFLYQIVFQGTSFGVWIDTSTGIYYITPKLPSDAEQRGMSYALTADDMRPNLFMIDRATPFIKKLTGLYRMGVCYFNSPATRERWIKMLRLLGLR